MNNSFNLEEDSDTYSGSDSEGYSSSDKSYSDFC